MLIGRHLCATRLARFAAVLLLLGAPGGTAFAEAEEGERKVVALLPIVIHSMDDQTFLRAGLGDMLLSRLGKEPKLAVLPVRDTDAATNDLETARARAAAVGAAFVVYGTFTHFGEGASVDLVAAPVSGDAFGPREVFVHAGTLGGVIPQLDGLMDRVARYIVEGPVAVPEDTDIAEAPNSAETAPVADGEGASSAELEALRRRVELLEETLGIEGDGDAVASDGEIEVPGIFQVYDDDGSPAPN